LPYSERIIGQIVQILLDALANNYWTHWEY
jgi:hypothetical protein